MTVLRQTAAAALLFALTSVSGLAQTAPPDALTLTAAFERAAASSPAVAAARLRRPIDVARLAVAGERPNPEATLEVEKETPRRSFALAMPLELGGKRARRLAAGAAAVRTGEAELAGTMLAVRNAVRRAYYGALAADARLRAQAELRDLAQRTRDAAQARFDRGDAAQLDVLQAELALGGAETEAMLAEGAVRAARSTLNAVLGAPPGAELVLTTPLDAGLPIAADDALAQARRASADLQLLDRRIDEERAVLALARALRVPDATPAATLTHGAEPEFTYGWRAAVTLAVPLFTRHQAGVRVEEAVLAQLTAERAASLQRIEASVAAAAASAESLRLAAARYRDEILPRAAQVDGMAQDAYRLGQTGLPALLQSLRGSRELRLRAVEAAAEYQSAVADLERAVGAPLP